MLYNAYIENSTFEAKNNNLEHLKEDVIRLNKYLDPLFEEYFNLTTRKEYLTASTESYLEDTNKARDRINNLGVVDKTVKNMLESADQDFSYTADLINQEAIPDTYFDVQNFAHYIREHFDISGEIEKNIKKIYLIPVTSWEDFLYSMESMLKNGPTYWDGYRKRSENFFS